MKNATTILFHRQFNSSVFNVDLSGQPLHPNLKQSASNKRMLSKEKYEEIVDAIENWGEGNVEEITDDIERERVKAFRKGKRNYYKHISRYRLEMKQTNGVLEKILHRREDRGLKRQKEGTVVLHEGHAFEILHRWHRSWIHAKTCSLYGRLKKTYYNFALDIVNKYVKMCPECARRNPTLKKLTRSLQGRFD
jgi:hypothetical protein